MERMNKKGVFIWQEEYVKDRRRFNIQSEEEDI